MKFASFIALLLIFFAPNVYSQSQETGVVFGYVTDRETGEPMRGVTIRVAGSQVGAISDSKGKFQIKNVPIGPVELVATAVGYELERTTVLLKAGGSRDAVFTMLQTGINTEQIVVSAGRRIQAVQDVPISVSTLSENDISTRGITQLDEALRYVSGVNVIGDQVNIRGASGFAFGLGSRTMVLLDGFPLLSGDNGDIKFDVLPVADVQRVEIIKGAGSALYGTGALGGVVSMITKPATEELDVDARVYGGAYTPLRIANWQDYRVGTPVQWGADARVSQKVGDFSYNFSGGLRRDESYRDFDQQLRGFGYSKLKYDVSDYASVTLFGLYASQISENYVYWRNLDFATLTAANQDPTERLLSNKLAVAVEWQQLIGATSSLTIRPGVFRTHFENQKNGIPQDSNTSTSTAYNIDVLYTANITDWLTATSGLTGRANVVNADVYGSQIQTIASVFAQAEATLAQGLIVTAGARVDQEETRTLDPQIQVSPKLGVSWNVSDELGLRASLGRGFRAATIAERFANIRYGPFKVVPNDSIRPESSWSGEIGARISPRNWLLPIEFDIAVFDNELFDLIEPTFDTDDPQVPIYFQNLTRARILGVEATVRTALSKNIGFETGLTAMMPRDLSLNETLKYRSSVLWYNRAQWQFDIAGVSLELQAEYRFQSRVENVDQRLNIFIPNAEQRVPNHVVDARLFWNASAELGAPVRVGIIGRNLLDYYYTEVVANLAPTRAVLMQIEWR